MYAKIINTGKIDKLKDSFEALVQWTEVCTLLYLLINVVFLTLVMLTMFSVSALEIYLKMP